MQQNACLYWLPCVFKTVPGSFHSILMELKQLFESKVAHVNTTDSNSILAAYIAVLKAGRSLALLKTSELVRNLKCMLFFMSINLFVDNECFVLLFSVQ